LKESIKNYENHVISLGKNKTSEEDCRLVEKKKTIYRVNKGF